MVCLQLPIGAHKFDEASDLLYLPRQLLAILLDFVVKLVIVKVDHLLFIFYYQD